ncbi:type 1 glutamine amidotransferase-like domain-containing protein [Sphingobacterium sp. SGG-5]|uniref:Type 1 glutamine amidotransferase-like domain-containing protein n=1 Tax=Sphingobacterium sp. SGG-5 TaxID=2710881 RepID=UPI0013ECF086|nr:Type 1 glutamine amidotransferase-like domain-containing protein [Sphingobacterium sp. SGG-5]NGM61779.1 type 1 glutamine amidotransferase-like domain-containing protein [Sphingobacterium sp. SGG-5]
MYKSRKGYRVQNLSWIIILGLVSFLSAHAQTRDVQAQYTKNWKTVGPPKGTLMIIGGAASSDNYSYFMDLVGDPDASIVFVPTAGSVFDETNSAYTALLKAGARNITIIHTKDPAEANTEAFAGPLQQAKAVFIAGGFQSRLAAAYRNTLTHQWMFELLERGGVIAGSSAGASIQGSYLYGGVPGGVGPQYVGLGFVRQSAIGQHYIRRNRMGSVARILKTHPELFGFGVDEATAAVVHGDTLEVVGEGKVALYDPTRPDYAEDRLQEYLFPGDKYNMATRKITHRAEPTPQDLWTGGGKNWKDPTATWKTVGPPRGKLLLYGSAEVNRDALSHFRKALRSPKDLIVVLSTGNDDRRRENQRVVEELQKMGAQQVTLLHTINGEKANSRAFARALDDAKAVWICDSPGWQLADVYLHTLVHKKLFDVLQRKGIVGGSGAGAAMMASRLFGEPEKYGWHTGFGLIDKTMIVTASQNAKTLAAIEKIRKENPVLQHVILVEKSALIVEKKQIKVIGIDAIKIYKDNLKKTIVVSPGERYKF